MTKKNLLYLVYHFSKTSEDLSVGHYEIIFSYTHDGEVLRKDYPEVFPAEKAVFTTKEELIAFCQNILQSKSFSAIYILSTADFNVGIETCQDLSSFKEIFKRYGQLIPSGSDDDDSNLFSKFF